MTEYVQDMEVIIVSEIDLLIQELRDTIDNQRETIDRLNNIINEIQDMCREEYYKKNTTDIDSIGLSNNIWVMIYMKIKENNK